MDGNRLFFSLVFLLSLVYIVFYLLRAFRLRKRLARVEAEIVQLTLAVDLGLYHINSQRAVLEYMVDGRLVRSSNSLSVASSAGLGDRKNIWYFLDSPDLVFQDRAYYGLAALVAFVTSILFLGFY